MGLDIVLFRKNAESIATSERKRGRDGTSVEQVINYDNLWKEKHLALDNANKQRNDLSKEIQQLIKAKSDQVQVKKQEMVEVKQQIDQYKAESSDLLRERDRILQTIGNIVHDSVLVSNNEENNVVEKTFGTFNPSNRYQHHELLNMIGGVESGVNVMGHRGYYLKGPGLMISLACINYGLSFLMKKGYVPVQPPYMMNKEVMAKVAQLSDYDETLYHVDEEKYLIATSEQPLCALHQNEWMRENDLQTPIRYAGMSTCFRKEAGAHGKDVRGIFRVHQFDKVEQFCITKPEDSWQELERMVQTSEEFYQSLNIPYRLITIVSGALNDAAAKKIDLEGWFPAQNDHKGTFRELVSCSNCTDYQSRALEIRYIPNDKNDSKQYVHMLNATLCANTRTVSALLENHQQENGIQLPPVLHPFLPEFVSGMPGWIPFTQNTQ